MNPKYPKGPSRNYREAMEMTVKILKIDNEELKERFDRVLKICCDAEADVEHYQAVIEELNLKIADMADAYQWKCFDVTTTNAKHLQEKAEIETRMAKVVREYDTLLNNYNYAKSHVAEYDKTMTEAKRIMEELRSKNKALSDAQVNSEHLARKLLQLQEKYNKSEADLSEFHAAFAHDYCCVGQRTHDATSMCGTCLECKFTQLEKILNQTVLNLKEANSERDINQKLLDEANRNFDALKANSKKEIDGLISIITAQQTALGIIAKGSFFGHKDLASNALLTTITKKKELGLLG